MTLKTLTPLSARLSLTLATAVLLAACAQTPAPVSVSDVVEATAVVEAIDPATRRVRLSAPDGRSRVIQAGPAVRNFEQLRVGDRVTIRYTEALAAEVVKPGAAESGARVASERTDVGSRPGGSESITLKGVVKVVSTDPVNHTVDIIGLDGAHRKVVLRDPKAREFARGLKPGDDVQLTFTEAVAVSVSPVR